MSEAHTFFKNNFADCENEAIAWQFAFDILQTCVKIGTYWT